MWTDFSPRVGFTYDLTGDGRNVVSSLLDLLRPDGARSALERVGGYRRGVRSLPMERRQRRRRCPSGEVNTSVPFVSKSTAYDPANPTNTGTTTIVDPDVKNDRTREFIVGFDRQVGARMAVGASYIWRKYNRFLWNDRINFSSSDYRAVHFQPTTCPAGARCEAITYYEPNFQIPSPNIYTNVPDRWRDFNGFELTFAKRHSNNWSFNASYAYNDAVEVFDSPASYEDPSCRSNECPGVVPVRAGIGRQRHRQRVPERQVAGQGGGTLLDGLGHQPGRRLPGEPRVIRSRSRSRRRSTATTAPAPSTILLDPMGEVRYETLHMMNFRVDKNFNFGRIDAWSSDGDLQPDQRQHRVGAAAQSGGLHREPRQRHRSPSRDSLRRAGEVLDPSGRPRFARKALRGRPRLTPRMG